LNERPPGKENHLGLDNYGNTCYCNSVLQALFYCLPLRRSLIDYAKGKDDKEEPTLLTCTAALFAALSSNRTGSLGPKTFIYRLRAENEMFRGGAQQDAHEFLIYLLNTVAEIHEKEMKKKNPNFKKTFVREIFEGTLTNETKCLYCENITSKDESFLDLSIDIEQNSSLTACLKKFSTTETLEKQNKFFCEYCCCLQEAQKRMKIKALPQALIIHLKRFKYVESTPDSPTENYGFGFSGGSGGGLRFIKLAHRVVFPFELRLPNVTASEENAEQLYQLFAVVIHIGSGPSQGHYISVVKSNGIWYAFDDDKVNPIKESQLTSIFGTAYSNSNASQTGYILFYTV